MDNAETISLELCALWQVDGASAAAAPASAPDETMDMLFFKRNAAADGFNEWTINDVAFSMNNPTPLHFICSQGVATGCACATPATTSIPSIFTGTASS